MTDQRPWSPAMSRGKMVPATETLRAPVANLNMSMPRSLRWLRSVALFAALVAGASLALPAAAAPPRAAWTAPQVERIIGAPSRPGVAAWGITYNPVTDEILVGDYVSDQVRR